MRKFLLIGVGVLFVGCGRQSGNTPSDAVEESEWFNSWVVKDTAQTGKGTLVAWWRQPVKVEPPVLEISVVGDSGYVKYYGKVTGLLHTYFYPEGDYTKPYGDSVRIEGVIMNLGDETPNWQVVKATGVVGVSFENPPSFTLDSVRISFGSYDTLVTDPMNLASEETVPHLTGADSVRFTVYATGDVVYLLHTWRGATNEHYRVQLVDTNSYALPAGTTKGLHWAIVDVFARSSVEDTSYPYENITWFIPYWVD